MLKITFPDGSKLNLTPIEEEIKGGQHGSPLVFAEKTSGKKYLLKPFYQVIDSEFSQLNAMEVDLEWDAARSKDRCQFSRIANEIVAANLASILNLNVPRCFPIVSSKVAKHKIKTKKKLSLGSEVKVLDEGGEAETYEEFFGFENRDTIKFDADKKFDELLLSRREGEYPSDSSFVMGIISEFVPDSMDLARAMDKASDDGTIDTWFTKFRTNCENGYYLLPFDTWLNDPDRNNQNYLVHEEKGKITVWGIDYEMWSFGADIPDEGPTKGRSYLAAILHKTTNLEDPRILKTLLQIRMLDESAIERITRMPVPLIQFVEYHIAKGNLGAEEREKIRSTEQDLFECLWETKPMMSRLEEILESQIGPPEWKD